MPELPEVETVRKGIASRAVGRRIERVEVGRERTVRRFGREALIDGLTGTVITAANRHGKYLLCPLDSGEQMMIHLRMSGRMLFAPVGSERPPHTHVVLHLAPLGSEEPCELRFVDPRTFGEVLVFDPANAAEQVPELTRLGPDPLVDEVTPDVLASRLRGKRGNMKATLLDQSVVAGIGNIYADEALWDAGIHPRARRLTRPAATRLVESLRAVLRAGIDAGGTTLRDYRDAGGGSGSFQFQLRCYGRAGEPCERCGSLLRRTTIDARSTTWCPSCQRR